MRVALRYGPCSCVTLQSAFKALQYTRNSSQRPSREEARSCAAHAVLRACPAAVRNISTRAITKPDTSAPRKVGHQQPEESLSAPVRQAADLFPLIHVPRIQPLFLLYFPIGVLVAAFRISLWVALLLFDQPWLTDNDASIAVLQAILGVKVEWRNADLIPRSRHVLVSNHVTTGDLIALYRRPERIVHLISTALPKRVADAVHHRVDLRHACLETYDRLATTDQTDSIHLFPEGGMTNGQGMMKFSRGFLRFADGVPVVPIALRAKTPWQISTHTLDSSFVSNLFWFCFCPTVSLQLTVLPPTTRQKDEAKAKFVERLQQAIADELGVPVLDFTIQAKKKLVQAKGRRR